MSDKPENPQAFPVSDLNITMKFQGMTLRDYFAGQSVAKAADLVLGCMPFSNTEFQSNVAFHAYAFADAMLAERAKR